MKIISNCKWWKQMQGKCKKRTSGAAPSGQISKGKSTLKLWLKSSASMAAQYKIT